MGQTFSNITPLSSSTPPSAPSAQTFSDVVPIGAPTSLSGGQNPAAPPTPTAPKVSDFVPDWQTPGKVAKGVGEGLYGMGKGLLNLITVNEPVLSQNGQPTEPAAPGAFSKIKSDIKERQYLGALADTINLIGGFDEQKAAQMWSAGKGAEAEIGRAHV